MRLTILTGILVALTSFSARAAAPISILGNEVHKTIACEGRDVKLAGNEATLKLTGECGRIDVMGNSNKISAETASKLAVSGNQNEVSVKTVKRIDLTGNENHVTWQNEVDGHAPKISNPGTDNTARRASGSGKAQMAAGSDDGDEDEDDEEDEEDSHSATVAGALSQANNALGALGGLGAVGTVSSGSGLVVSSSGLEQTYECNGQDVVVNGANNALSFTGECDKVTVNGKGNVVHLEAAKRITANGTENTVTWKRGADKRDPKVGIFGKRNKVSREK